MTRIAAGHPGIWPDICAENRTAIVEVLDELIGSLADMRAVVADDDRDGLLAVLEPARRARINLPARVQRPAELVELRVPVPDRPGCSPRSPRWPPSSTSTSTTSRSPTPAKATAGCSSCSSTPPEPPSFSGGLVAAGYRPTVHALE